MAAVEVHDQDLQRVVVSRLQKATSVVPTKPVRDKLVPLGWARNSTDQAASSASLLTSASAPAAWLGASPTRRAAT